MNLLKIAEDLAKGSTLTKEDIIKLSLIINNIISGNNHYFSNDDDFIPISLTSHSIEIKKENDILYLQIYKLHDFYKPLFKNSINISIKDKLKKILE